MRRALLLVVLLAAVVAAIVLVSSGSADTGYLVRGYFDNGGFVVKGEDVRIAGAAVGSVDSLDVSMPGEAVRTDGKDDPGKAVIVMKITDPGFQDFRTDASCLIRPQSLLGEKFIDCSPTQPRAPGTKPPPELTTIADGKPGAGQHFLPLENNGKQVDLDIVQNILRLPYAQRFRLILNDLGAGLAARGHDLEAIVRRADPALRETDQVLGILAGQNHELAKLASDSNAILAPLARERQHVSGFIRNAGTTAQATAERGAELQAGLQKFPRFFNQLRTTMVSLRSFSTQAQPVFASLGAAAPSLTRLTKKLAPFSAAGETAFKSLGSAAQASTHNLVASDSVVKDLRDLSRKSQSPSTNLNRLTTSLEKTQGFKRLLDFIYHGAGSVNGFDQYGHFLRSALISSNCVDYVIALQSGCSANFSFAGVGKAPALASVKADVRRAKQRHRRAPQRQSRSSAGGAGLAATRDLLRFLLGNGGGNSAAGGGTAGGSAGGSGQTTTPEATTPTTTTPTPPVEPQPEGVGK
jgi:phospholipid/cholesterol/gamma-HCH transport system substrate-binding protein